MASPARQIESKVLKLSSRERARLAERLIASLDDEADADAEAVWVREADLVALVRNRGGLCCRRDA